VRVYMLSWEATGSSPPTGGSNPVFHVDLTDGGAVRTYTTGARLDHARVAPAVRQFAPQVQSPTWAMSVRATTAARAR